MILPIELPSTTRIVWTSERAREAWEAGLEDARTAVSRLEIESVKAGQRICSWQTMDEAEYPAWAATQAEAGLITIAVRRSLQFQGFAHRFEDPQPGQPAAVSAILTRDFEAGREFLAAFKAGDMETQGRLLGYPACCRAAFRENWAAGIYDPIWEAGLQTPHLEALELEGPIRAIRLQEDLALSNPMLRYIGPRPGFHIPHSFNCRETARAAEERLELATADERTLIKALLAMPMSWDAYHGLAVIRTPIFYIITKTTPRTERLIIEKPGTFYPAEAATGCIFPFTGGK